MKTQFEARISELRFKLGLANRSGDSVEVKRLEESLSWLLHRNRDDE